MSGKHQRRMWVLPAPTGSTSYYDRMHIVVGRSMSKSVVTQHDTLSKVLTSIRSLFDTFIRVFVSGASATSSAGSGRISDAPFVTHKKKKRYVADEIISLDTLDISKVMKKNIVKLKSVSITSPIIETKISVSANLIKRVVEVKVLREEA